MSDVFEKLRDVVAYSYKMGYHEHGVDLVTDASDALGEWIDKTTALQSRLDLVEKDRARILADWQAVTSRLQGAVNLVSAQAEDDGLWFIAENASEAHLQQELRKLHAAIESTTPPPEVDSKSRLKRIAIQRGESGEDAYRGKDVERRET